MFRSLRHEGADYLENWQGWLRRGPYVYAVRVVAPPGTVSAEGFVAMLTVAAMKLVIL